MNRLAPVTPDRLLYVCQNMRPRDAEEIYAQRWDDNPEALTENLMRLPLEMAWIWERDGIPVSVQGVVPIRPGVWDVFAFGTSDWSRVVLDMTRHARRFIIPALLRARFHRAECRALASYDDSRRWIETLGAKQESILKGYGRDGQDFVAYVWTPADVSTRQE